MAWPTGRVKRFKKLVGRVGTDYVVSKSYGVIFFPSNCLHNLLWDAFQLIVNGA